MVTQQTIPLVMSMTMVTNNFRFKGMNAFYMTDHFIATISTNTHSTEQAVHPPHWNTIQILVPWTEHSLVASAGKVHNSYSHVP